MAWYDWLELGAALAVLLTLGWAGVELAWARWHRHTHNERTST